MKSGAIVTAGKKVRQAGVCGRAGHTRHQWGCKGMEGKKEGEKVKESGCWGEVDTRDRAGEFLGIRRDGGEGGEM